MPLCVWAVVSILLVNAMTWGYACTVTHVRRCASACASCRGMIAVTQPRRVAALTVARRVAEERGVQLGQEVRGGVGVGGGGWGAGAECRAVLLLSQASMCDVSDPNMSCAWLLG